MTTKRDAKRMVFLWFEWERIGYVEQATLFGYKVWSRCGAVRELFGFKWIQHDRH